MLIKFIVFMVAFLICMIFIPVFKKYSLRKNILIAQGVPLVGGIGLGLSFLGASIIGYFLFGGLSIEFIGVLVSSLAMLILGLRDDLKELSVLGKFLVQILAAAVLICFGVRTHIVYIGTVANIMITFIWILGITNAFNHLDVMDGLAGVTTLIVSFAFFVISILNADIKVMILSLALMGAAAGFLIYNLPPAKVYMGNSGSHFLGFILAAVALIISYAPMERKVALLSPLLILGFPVFDTFFLILTRTIQKKSAFKKSDDHIALRFLKLGYSKAKILILMSLLCLFFSVCGIAVSQISNLLSIAVVIFAVLASLILTIRICIIS